MDLSRDRRNLSADNEPDSWSALPHSQTRSKDSRREGRSKALFRPALVEIEDFAGFCLVRNLSANGMMASVYARFAPNQSAMVQFSDDIVVPGRIVWSEDERIGVEFEHEIDVDTVLREQGTTSVGGMAKRAPRLPIDCEGELVLEGSILTVRVLDISQRGIKVTGTALRQIQQSAEVIVRLPEAEPRKAVVRWAQAGTMGLNFLRPFGFRELAEWVIARNSLQG